MNLPPMLPFDKWTVQVRKDLARGNWHDGFGYAYTEVFWILATNGSENYAHYLTFVDDWEGANKLYQRIQAAPNFSPEGKKGVWFRVYDLKPFAARNPKNLRWWFVESGPRKWYDGEDRSPILSDKEQDMASSVVSLPENARQVTWADLNIGDVVYIGWSDFIAHNRPPVKKYGGPHTVVSPVYKELTNGLNCFKWEGDMYAVVVSLGDVGGFPEQCRSILKGTYGIESAEAFYTNATQNEAGMREALGVDADALKALVELTTPHLSEEYKQRCLQSKRHPRGARS